MLSPGRNRKGGGGVGRDRQMPMGAQGRTRKRGCHHMRWALVQHTDGLLSDRHLPGLGGLPNTVGSSSYKQGGQSHGRPGVAPMHSSRLPALRTGRTPPAEQLEAEELKAGQSRLSQALHTGGEQDSWLTGNAYILTSTQEALNQ